MTTNTSSFLVEPKRRISLDASDPGDTGGLKKKNAQEELVELRQKLSLLQSLMYATEEHSLLIVLQGMDTAGKDGVIKHVVGSFNPQGCQVSSFKVPTSEELSHDFLWRIHRSMPGRGCVGIFNRSHYEDVLVARVEGLVPDHVWQRRYQEINRFEKMLADNGTVMVKFFLHISKDEQRRRLEDRLQDPAEHWKFRVGDLKTRARWDDYMRAYEDALSQCNTEYAPWYVIPSDAKWYRNLIISRIIVEKLEALNMQWPELAPELVGLKIE